MALFQVCIFRSAKRATCIFPDNAEIFFADIAMGDSRNGINFVADIHPAAFQDNSQGEVEPFDVNAGQFADLYFQFR